jgi:hypothetical protein
MRYISDDGEGAYVFKSTRQKPESYPHTIKRIEVKAGSQMQQIYIVYEEEDNDVHTSVKIKMFNSQPEIEHEVFLARIPDGKG